MRFANVGGRMHVVTPEGMVDASVATGGRVESSPLAFYDAWPRVLDALSKPGSAMPSPAGPIGAPSPQPRQVFAAAVNYPAHAEETVTSLPEAPLLFTKFRSSLAPPDSMLHLPSSFVDWEIELVVVVGRAAADVKPPEVWSHVAGLTIGQDFTDRGIQMVGPLPQFSLGKSYPGFGPTGPVLATIDEFDDPDDLLVETKINGETVQRARTSQMLFPVSELISYISGICPLLPGDLVFTGTPAGVGFSRNPARYLRPGDEVTSTIEGIGSFLTTCMA